MTPDQFKQLLITIITSLGGIGLILGAIFTWLGKLLVDKIYLKTSMQYQKDIDKLRDSSAERRDFINSLLATISNQHSKSYDKVLVAVEVVWKKVLEIKDFTRPFVFVYVVFPPEMIERTTDKFFDTIPSMTFEKFVYSTNAIVDEVKKVRPFIGENLWKIFFVYQAIITRISWKVLEGKTQKKLYSWDKDAEGKRDEHLLSLLRQIFSEEEVLALTKSVDDFRTIDNIFEIKILEEMNRLILGQNLVNRTIDEYIRFAEISVVKTKNNPSQTTRH